KKDSGDDPDVTNGMMIYATLTKTEEKIIKIDGGFGIGRVTKSGLDQAVGNAAINSVPRMTIEQSLNEVSEEFSYYGGFDVKIFAPQGEELAKKTYNSRLGIIGGLSILGTTGIVEPMSEDAIVDTIYAQINVQYEEGKRYLLFTPGNYGNDFIKENYTIDKDAVIKCSNYIGNAIDYAYSKGFEAVLVIGHAGKLLKLACGLFNTHSKFGDCRAEVLSTYSAIHGAKSESIEKIINSVTADEMITEIKKIGLDKKVLADVMKRIEFHLNARVYSDIKTGAIVFTDKLGIIGKTENAEELLEKISQGR
ncbi:MAG: cobalt-precorrin-5B (C(1))-methyltransferase CbiD, partial [Clostridia bacterium]